MFFYDPTYLIVFFLIPMVLGGIASLRVKAAFAKYSKVASSSRVTGAEAARTMLRAAGLEGVGVERVSGHLSDHYDPRVRVLRLSPDVHDSHSVAALGVACHEAGHAIQHARNYGPLALRNLAVPVASFGSNSAFIFIMIGLGLMYMGAQFGIAFAYLGVILFAGVVFFQIVNLPVEFDASSRAKKMLPQLGLISGRDEQAGVNRVLNAAAMTYVAATVVAAMQLLYFISLIARARR